MNEVREVSEKSAKELMDIANDSFVNLNKEQRIAIAGAAGRLEGLLSLYERLFERVYGDQ